MSRNETVSKLRPPNGFTLSDEDPDEIFDSLKKASRKDISFPTSSQAEEILDPFEGLHDAMNTAMENQNKHAQQKWDLINMSSFSPKYIRALDAVKNKQNKINESANIESEQSSSSKECPLIDDEFQSIIDELIKENCSMKIDIPKRLFKNVVFPYNPSNDILLKKRESLSPKRKLNGVNFLEPINIKSSEKPVEKKEEASFNITPSNYHLFREYDEQSDQIINPFTWEELDNMKIKCAKWLNKSNIDLPQGSRKK